MAWVNGVELIDPVSGLTDVQCAAYEAAQRVWKLFLRESDGRSYVVLARDGSGLLQPPKQVGVRLLCGEAVTSSHVGGRCGRVAGFRTAHIGVGPCVNHYGRGESWSTPLVRAGNAARPVEQPRVFERALWSWVMAHAYAQARDTTPWQALLDEVKDLAGQVAWLNDRLLDAEKVGGDDALRPGGDGWDWVQMRDARGDRLARVSKMAIDAGVATYLVHQVRAQGELMFRAASLAAAELELPEADQLRLVTALARKLTELEAAQAVAVGDG